MYGLAHVLTRSVTFLLLPYYSHKISAAEYGELSLYFMFLAVVQTFYVYGLDVAYLRYYNLADHGRSKAQVNGSVLIATLISTAVLSIALAGLAVPLGSLLIDKPLVSATVAKGVLICVGILIFDTISTYPFLKLRSDNRPLVFAGQKLINVTLNIALNVLLVGHYALGVSGVLYANLISSAVTCALLLPGILRASELHMDWPLLREMLKFGLPNIPTYLSVMIVELAGRKAIELYRGVEEAGLYSAGCKLGMFMGVVNAAYRFAWQPFFLKHAQDQQAQTLFSKAMTYYLLAACAFLVWLSLLGRDLLTANWPVVGQIIAPAFWGGLSVFPIILAAHIFDGIYANLMVGIYLKKATRKLPAVTGVAAAFTIAANIALVPALGMMASAWITFAAFLIQAVLLYRVVWRLYPVHYEWKRIALLGLVTIVFTLVATLADVSLGWRIALAFAFPIVIVVLRFFPESEIVAIKRLIRR
ncbi:MAG: lipopolysaccharide biosynthesis protein [bacterium]|nr:lipopolysaccharide biosynthesis protein [bacterium]